MMSIAHPPAPDDHSTGYAPSQSSSTTPAQQYQMEQQRRLRSSGASGAAAADDVALGGPPAKVTGLDPLAISPKGRAPISGLPSERQSPHPQLQEAHPVEQTAGMPGSFPEDQE